MVGIVEVDLSDHRQVWLDERDILRQKQSNILMRGEVFDVPRLVLVGNEQSVGLSRSAGVIDAEKQLDGLSCRGALTQQDGGDFGFRNAAAHQRIDLVHRHASIQCFRRGDRQAHFVRACLLIGNMVRRCAAAARAHTVHAFAVVVGKSGIGVGIVGKRPVKAEAAIEDLTLPEFPWLPIEEQLVDAAREVLAARDHRRSVFCQSRADIDRSAG